MKNQMCGLPLSLSGKFTTLSLHALPASCISITIALSLCLGTEGKTSPTPSPSRVTRVVRNERGLLPLSCPRWPSTATCDHGCGESGTTLEAHARSRDKDHHAEVSQFPTEQKKAHAQTLLTISSSINRAIHHFRFQALLKTAPSHTAKKITASVITNHSHPSFFSPKLHSVHFYTPRL